MLNVGNLNIGFVTLTVIAVFYFFWATGKQIKFLVFISFWLAIHAFLALSGFYLETKALPPRLMLAMVPALLATIIIGFTKVGTSFRDKVSVERLHYYHLIRIPVEVIFIHGLFQYGYAAKHITFEGTNFDVWIGISAIIIALLRWKWKFISNKQLILWNVLGIIILLSVIIQAIFSLPYPFQLLSLEQPTTAILYFPFIWLATGVAPLAILAHTISIKKLMK